MDGSLLTSSGLLLPSKLERRPRVMWGPLFVCVWWNSSRTPGPCRVDVWAVDDEHCGNSRHVAASFQANVFLLRSQNHINQQTRTQTVTTLKKKIKQSKIKTTEFNIMDGAKVLWPSCVEKQTTALPWWSNAIFSCRCACTVQEGIYIFYWIPCCRGRRTSLVNADFVVMNFCSLSATVCMWSAFVPLCTCRGDVCVCIVGVVHPPFSPCLVRRGWNLLTLSLL